MYEQHIEQRAATPGVIGIGVAAVPLDLMPRLSELNVPTVRIPTNLHPAYNRTDKDNQPARYRRKRPSGWDTNTPPTSWPGDVL